jgi:membrane protein YdbS with pleckstrin-like domain
MKKKTNRNGPGIPSRRSDNRPPIDQERLEAGRKLIKEFIRNKHWELYLYIFLLFSMSIAYIIVLYYTLDTFNSSVVVAQIFLVFTIICCLSISIIQYNDMKDEIDVALKDLQIMFK